MPGKKKIPSVISWAVVVTAIAAGILLAWFSHGPAGLVIASLTGGLLCVAGGFFVGARHAHLLDSLFKIDQPRADILIEQLAAMASRIGSYPDEETILEVTASLLQKQFPHCNGAISRFSPEGDRIEIACLWTTQGEYFPLLAPEKMANTAHEDPERIKTLCQQAIDKQLNPHVLSLKAQGMNLGNIRLWQNGQKTSLNLVQYQFLDTCGFQTALSLSNIETHRRLHRQTVRDPLTGLFNKSYLLDTLQRELHRSKRYKHSLGIIMMEIDRFADIKEEQGNEAVNKILVAIAGIFQGTFRGQDISCRYRENTLVQILPEASLANTLKRAEQVSEWINELNIPFRDTTLTKITVSTGISGFPDHADTIDALVQAVESAV